MAGNLGVLTLDLIARTGGFVAGMDKAERQSLKWRKQVEQDMKAAGTAIGVGVAAGTAALAALTASSVNAAKEISQFSALANASTTEFQWMAVGAQQMGIEQEQLASVLKDVNDRVGEFLARGGGEMADFFKEIAPQVGVTAEQFRNLSGPDALQLYFSSLEKANVSQAELVTYMEAMADDSTRLIPLLRNNGEGMKLFADEAERAGAILSQDTIKRANELSAGLFLMDNASKGLKNQLSAALIPVLGNFAEGLSGISKDGTLAATVADDLAGALQGIGKAAVGSVAGLHLAGKAIQGLHELNEASKGDGAWWENWLPPVRLYRAWENFDKIKESASGTAQELDQIAQGYGDFLKKLDGEDGGAGEERLKKLAGFMEQWEKLQGGMAGGVASGGSGSDNGAAKAIASQIDALQLQAKTVGMTTEAVTLYKLEQDGATKAQLAQAKAAFETVEAFEKQQEAMKEQARLAEEVASVVASTWSEQSRALDEYQQKVQTLREGVLAGVITEDAASQAVGLLDSQLTQRLDELGETTGTFWEEWLVAAEDNLTSFDELSASVIENFGAGVGSAFEGMLTGTKDLDEALLGLAQNTVQSVVNALGQMAAQWVALQAVQLALGKSTQASAIVGAAATGTAMASAYAPAAAMASLASFGANSAPAIAGITATTTTAQGLALMGMAHDGIDSIPQDGTWLLQKGERVTTAETSAKLDRTLEDVQRNRQDGGTPNVIVNNYSSARVQTRRNDAGELEFLIEEMDKRLANRIYADESKTGKAIEAVYARRRPFK